jgi:predicted amidohydrolase
MAFAACIQLTSTADVTKNLVTCSRLVAEARQRGAQLAVLPENFALMGTGEREKFEVAESLSSPGKILTAVQTMARTHGIWVIAGGMPEKTTDPGKVHNLCAVVNAAGEIVASYRKIHLFDVKIPGGAEFQESATVAPGGAPVVADTPIGKVGLSICYDVRFPELYRQLVAAGARIVVVPAAFTLHTGKDHWQALLRARAIENQVYVLAAAQYGRANEKRVCWGHSLIADPWGTVIAEAPDRECAIVAELDDAYQDKIRRELPVLSHRRL